MANLFLTAKCNLKCPYCFAAEFVNESDMQFTPENFKKAVNFIKTENNERIGLIGGEPLLYPYFKEIINLLNNDNAIQQYIIYTNGLELDKYINDLSNKKSLILVNCNSPQDIGLQYEKLKYNIKLLHKNKISFVAGINLYSEKQDYSFIFELLKNIDSHNLRFSISIPDIKKDRTINALDSFNRLKPCIINFFTDCIKNETVPYFDCNSIPLCLLNYKEKKLLIEIKKLAQKYNAIDLIYSHTKCSPVIDIFPDLTAIRCFGTAQYFRTSINKFKTLKDLKKYFYNKIDIYTNLLFHKKECENCENRLLDKCGICYAYKTDDYNCLKNLISNIN